MTILADFNTIFTNILLVVHVGVCLLLCLVVLMQRPKQEGLGAAFGGGMTDQAFGARTTDVLQKATVYLGSTLFIITFALSVLIASKSSEKKITTLIENGKQEQLSDKAIKQGDLPGVDSKADSKAASEEDLSKEMDKVTAPEDKAKTPASETGKPAPTTAPDSSNNQ